VSKATIKKHLRERAVKARRDRKLARRHKPRSSHMPTYLTESGELAKYAELADSLDYSLYELGELLKQRAEFSGQLEALGITRGRLNQSILDAESDPQTLLQTARELEGEELLLKSSLAAIGPRVQKAEGWLHDQLPLALDTFATLRRYTLDCVLETARQAVRALVDPSITVDPTHIDAIAIASPAFVVASRIQIPGVSWSWSRPLDEKPIYWSTLARPFTPEELALDRSRTVDSLIQATKSFLEAARRILEAVTPYADQCPTFKCEAEVVPPAVVDPKFLEWQQPLGGSDEQWCQQVCKQAGKPYPPESDTDKLILAEMLQQRHAHPISHGIVTSEMVGSTFVEE
jgi:hypothetical protein